MTKRPSCGQCGNDAIGIQSFGCRTAVVCEDHAHGILLALGPGQNYSSGDCTFERFSAAGTVPDDVGRQPPDCG